MRRPLPTAVFLIIAIAAYAAAVSTMAPSTPEASQPETQTAAPPALSPSDSPGDSGLGVEIPISDSVRVEVIRAGAEPEATTPIIIFSLIYFAGVGGVTYALNKAPKGGKK